MKNYGEKVGKNTRSRGKERSAVSIIVGMLIAQVALAEGEWRLTEVSALPGSSSCVAQGLNNPGDVVGYCWIDGDKRGFIWRGGDPVALTDISGGIDTDRACGVNDRGLIAGYGSTSDGSETFMVPLVWRNATSMIQLTDPSGVLTPTSTVDVAINNVGEVVGQALTPDFDTRAYLWSKGVMRDLGSLPGYDSTFPYGINNLSQVVGNSSSRHGTHAFLWSKGKMTDLGVLPGDLWSSATAINDAGQVVGLGQLHGFLWQNGVMSDIGDFSPSAINNVGQIVGSEYGFGTYPHAVLWENNVLTDLNTLPGVAGASVELRSAVDVNDAGQILIQGYDLSESRDAVYLLSPQDGFLEGNP